MLPTTDADSLTGWRTVKVPKFQLPLPTLTVQYQFSESVCWTLNWRPSSGQFRVEKPPVVRQNTIIYCMQWTRNLLINNRHMVLLIVEFWISFLRCPPIFQTILWSCSCCKKNVGQWEALRYDLSCGQNHQIIIPLYYLTISFNLGF